MIFLSHISVLVFVCAGPPPPAPSPAARASPEASQPLQLPLGTPRPGGGGAEVGAAVAPTVAPGVAAVADLDDMKEKNHPATVPPGRTVMSHFESFERHFFSRMWGIALII